MSESTPSSLRKYGQLLGVLSIPLLGSCGPASALRDPDPSRPPSPPSSPPATTQPDRRDARERLLEVLSGLPRAEPVLGALDPRQRAQLDRMLAALSSAEVEQLRASDSPMVAARPLLHLMAGGSSPDALLTLATSARASEELLQLSEPLELGNVLTATNEVVRRAALSWLDWARATLESRDVDQRFCDAVDRVAATLDSKPLRRASRELWLQLDPSAAAELNVAQALLWLGDVDAAEVAYRKARSKVEPDSEVFVFVERLGDRLERAKQLTLQAGDLETRIARAQAYLEIGNPGAARKLLEKDRGAASKHLALAATLLKASFPGLPCTGVLGGLGHPALCAFVQQRDVFPSQPFADLERAFESGAGRSPSSLQDYLGLKLVLPWKAESALTGRVDVAARAGTVAKVAGSLASSYEDLAAIALFAAALEASARAVTEAPQGRSPSVPAARAAELSKQALSLADTAASSRRARAALLAVAAVLSQQSDIRELLDHAAGADPMLSLTEAALGIWASATWGDEARYEKAQGRALAVMTLIAPESMARSALVLLLAESEFALHPTEKNIKKLEAVARKLASPELPSELSLRAALDQSACLEKLGKPAAAEGALHGVLRGLPKRDLTRVPGLAALARARLALLAGPDTKPAERLRSFEAAFADEALSSSIVSWRAAWHATLSRGRQPRAKAPRLQPSTGAVQARLAARDLLTLGALELSFDYYPELGVVPLVRAEPQLLFVPFP